eukprot:CAMPEP_0185728496 /NCGR_PEP_ID=MMETSP1171-20130828/3813_1 /TAXON_ID=374046 /ORGANISM="Helicotheca tamensis, Strain CCMP826" /LENGTH=251 /DNA_ID=CAMNT_0028397211 /DNA_START=25 /DNA_END=777 /DNA_ORIENTATION=-
MSLQSIIISCQSAINASDSLKDAKQHAITFMAEHQTLVERNACLESDISKLNDHIRALEEGKVSSGEKLHLLVVEKEKVEYRNRDLDNQVTTIKENLISAKERIEALSKEKAAFVSEKSALRQEINNLATQKQTAEKQAQDLINQNEEMNEMIKSMKAELLEPRKESACSIDGALCACPDDISFAEVSFDGFSSDGENTGGTTRTDDDDDSDRSCSGVVPNCFFETPTKRKRRVAKAYHSPKKWRRMVRDN